VDKLNGTAFGRVRGTTAVIVSSETLREVSGFAYVEGVVGAAKNIDEPHLADGSP
jgi:hypothetical protein